MRADRRKRGGGWVGVTVSILVEQNQLSWSLSNPFSLFPHLALQHWTLLTQVEAARPHRAQNTDALVPLPLSSHRHALESRGCVTARPRPNADQGLDALLSPISHPQPFGAFPLSTGRPQDHMLKYSLGVSPLLVKSPLPPPPPSPPPLRFLQGHEWRHKGPPCSPSHSHSKTGARALAHIASR